MTNIWETYEMLFLTLCVLFFVYCVFDRILVYFEVKRDSRICPYCGKAFYDEEKK